MTAFF